MKRIAQLCILAFFIITSFSVAKKESVTIYGIKISASDVGAQKTFSGVSKLYETRLLSPLEEYSTADFFYKLGTYRNDYQYSETLDLFNLSLENRSYPFLDSIDFDFYQSRGFDIIEQKNPAIVEEAKYVDLKKRINETKEIKERKKILFEDQYRYFRNLLLASRYDITSKKFTITKEKVSKTTAELKAKLDTIIINSNLQASANIRAYLSRLADETVKIEGIYWLGQLHPNYIAKISYYMRTTAASIKYSGDQFGNTLKDYVTNGKAAANTGLAAIQIAGYVDKTRIKVDSISSELQAKSNIPADKATSIATQVNFEFTRSETLTLHKMFNSVFVIRYFTSKIIDELPQ